MGGETGMKEKLTWPQKDGINSQTQILQNEARKNLKYISNKKFTEDFLKSSAT